MVSLEYFEIHILKAIELLIEIIAQVQSQASSMIFRLKNLYFLQDF